MLAAHGISGFFGILFIGFFASATWNGVSDGLFFGDPGQLWDQVQAALAAPAYAFVGTYVLLRLIGAARSLRVTEREEGTGPRRRAARRGGVRPGRRRDPHLARGRVCLRARGRAAVGCTAGARAARAADRDERGSQPARPRARRDYAAAIYGSIVATAIIGRSARDARHVPGADGRRGRDDDRLWLAHTWAAVAGERIHTGHRLLAAPRAGARERGVADGRGAARPVVALVLGWIGVLDATTRRQLAIVIGVAQLFVWGFVLGRRVYGLATARRSRGSGTARSASCSLRSRSPSATDSSRAVYAGLRSG